MMRFVHIEELWLMGQLFYLVGHGERWRAAAPDLMTRPPMSAASPYHPPPLPFRPSCCGQGEDSECNATHSRHSVYCKDSFFIMHRSGLFQVWDIWFYLLSFMILIWSIVYYYLLYWGSEPDSTLVRALTSHLSNIMWPRFEAQSGHHIWVECVVGPCSCSKRFFSK